MNRRPVPRDVDEYIAAFPTDVRPILTKIRWTIQRAAPEARERISYGIPAFAWNGIVPYFAAFKMHIGLYPPIKGDENPRKAVSPYAGEKGRLARRRGGPPPRAS